MLGLSAYDGLPFFDQLLHSVHFMLCAFAVVIACVPLFTTKGSLEHKFAGMIYVPLSLAALALASYLAWHEASMLLFCFNCFCAYLLLSGWRAVHEKEKPGFIDWLIPGSLFLLATCMTFYAMFEDEGLTTLYIFMFVFNAFFLSIRDFRLLRQRADWVKNRIFFAGHAFGLPQASEWLNRHIAGMVGSVMANLSVVVLTLLPLSLHWIWPVTLILLAAGIAWQQRQRRARVRKVVANVLQPKFRYPLKPVKSGDDLRRAA